MNKCIRVTPGISHASTSLHANMESSGILDDSFLLEIKKMARK